MVTAVGGHRNDCRGRVPGLGAPLAFRSTIDTGRTAADDSNDGGGERGVRGGGETLACRSGLSVCDGARKGAAGSCFPLATARSARCIPSGGSCGVPVVGPWLGGDPAEGLRVL